MNILGVGPGELVAIFLIALVVAGPKRMIVWSYTAGKYVAQLRKMFNEATQAIMSEFNAELTKTGIDPVKDLSLLRGSRFNILNEANKLLDKESTGQPVQGAVQDVPDDVI